MISGSKSYYSHPNEHHLIIITTSCQHHSQKLKLIPDHNYLVISTLTQDVEFLSEMTSSYHHHVIVVSASIGCCDYSLLIGVQNYQFNGYITVISQSHHSHIIVTSPSHHIHITVTSQSHHSHITFISVSGP